MWQQHECTFFVVQQPNNSKPKHVNANVDALGPEQGPEARLPEQGLSAWMLLPVE